MKGKARACILFAGRLAWIDSGLPKQLRASNGLPSSLSDQSWALNALGRTKLYVTTALAERETARIRRRLGRKYLEPKNADIVFACRFLVFSGRAIESTVTLVTSSVSGCSLYDRFVTVTGETEYVILPGNGRQP
jgi:hypothetical protein